MQHHWPALLALLLSPICAGAIDRSRWHGRSIYFLLLDRFARDSEDVFPMCGFAGDGFWTQWCGGTLKGVTRKLDYIQGMGFDAIWITPVVKQVERSDKYNTSPYHGYWAEDLWAIDPHYGTEEDLKELSRQCHRRSMLLMLDVVANHVGPVHSLSHILTLGEPFNDPSGDQFHQLGRLENQSLESYLKAPTPAFTNVLDSKGNPWYFCYTGNYSCPTYTERHTLEGWFGDLADLNHENPIVREYLKRWIFHMVSKFQLDGIRLDTAAYMPHWFLEEFQEAAGVVVLGEVISYNMTYHSSFQQPLTGLLNSPPALRWTSFNDMSNDVWHPQYGDFRPFSQLLEAQKSHPYTDLHLLGNYIDNHDTGRFLLSHFGDQRMLENALVWCFFHHGIPILYYGTEQPIVSMQAEPRRSMWFQPWDNHSDVPYASTGLYEFVARLNSIRKQHGLAHGGRFATSLAEPVLAIREAFAFVRGDLLVVVASVPNWTTPRFCFELSSLPQAWGAACTSHGASSLLGSAPDPQCGAGRICFEVWGGRPSVFALRPAQYVSPLHSPLLLAVLMALVAMTAAPLWLSAARRCWHERHRGPRSSTGKLPQHWAEGA